MLYVTKVTHQDEAVSRVIQCECLSAGHSLEEALSYSKPYLTQYANAMTNVPDGCIFHIEKYDNNKHKDTNRYHLVTV